MCCRKTLSRCIALVSLFTSASIGAQDSGNVSGAVDAAPTGTGSPYSRAPAAARATLIPPAHATRTVQTPHGALRYSVTWAERPVLDAQGKGRVTISTLAYERLGVSAERRPVIFAFGGGPGAAASGLGYGWLAPVRYARSGSDWHGEESGAARIEDNPDTVLDAADIVLIDTPGSGFTHELQPGSIAFMYTAKVDADAVEAAIRGWLTDHGRGHSPVFIIGESYGGYRIAILAPRLKDLDVAGLVLVSPALDLTDQPGNSGTPDLHFVFNFPTEAVAAGVHGKVDVHGRSTREVFDAARAFADNDLLTALQPGAALPATRRDAVAHQMEAFIGIPAAVLAKVNLRLDPQTFLETLVPGRVVGRLDIRQTGPSQKTALVDGRSKQADDPALGIGASNIRLNPSVAEYLRGIGVESDAPYVSLNLNMNLNLDWAFASREFEDIVRLNPTPGIARLMEERKSLRVLLLSGYFDMTCPIAQQQYAITHAGLPLARTTMVALAGPHAIYTAEPARREMTSDLRALMSGGQSARSPQD